MDPQLYNVIWFVLVGVLFGGYAVLDGFDLGVGTLHLLTRNDTDRRVLINSIGPVWDGNQVWLVTGGGALFAAFPHAYATAFSGFYIAFTLLLFTLIFRAISIHVRSLRPGARWRSFWDVAFSVASLLIALLMGVAVGNLAWGVPVAEGFLYRGLLWEQVHPYTLVTGLTAVTLFAMHGAIYLVMKTEGELHEQVSGWVKPSIWVFLATYALATVASLAFVPRLTAPFVEHPTLAVVPLMSMLAIANIPREIHHGRELRAFLSSSAAIALLLSLVWIGLFPELIPSTLNPEWSLDIYNAASSTATLKTMLVMACIGLPLVLGYTFHIYSVFRGKVKLDSMSY